jgi:predicted aspartyl protease
MMTGKVSNRLSSILAIRMRGPTGREVAIKSTIDTGSSLSLTVPLRIAESLELVAILTGAAQLADGTLCRYPIFRAELEWHGQWRGITVAALGDESLLGTGLLAGQSLHIDYVPGGAVEVRPLGG